MRESVKKAKCGWWREGIEVEPSMSLGFSHVHLPSQMFCWIRIITPLEGSRLVSGTQTTRTCSQNWALIEQNISVMHIRASLASLCSIFLSNFTIFPIFIILRHQQQPNSLSILLRVAICKEKLPINILWPFPSCAASLKLFRGEGGYDVALYLLPWIKKNNKSYDKQCFSVKLIPLAN